MESVGVKEREREGERLKYNQKYAQLNAKNTRNTQIQRMTYGYDKHLLNTLPPTQKATHRTEAASTHLEPIDKPEISP